MSSLVAGLGALLSAVELILLSLAVELGPSLVPDAELRALQVQAVLWKVFQVQAAGLEAFQDFLAESVVWMGFAVRV